MSVFGALFSSVMDLMQIEFTLFGFTISWWQVFVFTVVAGIASWIIWEAILGD